MGRPSIVMTVGGEQVTADLGPLLLAVYDEITPKPTDVALLHAALERLLEFLASPSGRTNANCHAADSFFCFDDGWETDWNHLPDEYSDILADMAGALHDTVSNPDVASNFDSTPEQLLVRLRRIAE